VVARGMGKPCVCGASNIVINYQDKTLSYYDKVLREGDKITINGSTGEIILGEVETIDPEFTDEFLELMSWADEKRTLKVRANAETERDTKVAKNFGAEGIGLCRTEHMFFDDERIIAMREMIVARSKEDREKALAKLLPMQRADFVTIFRTMAGKPVTIRLLDPPLHEFLPHTEEEIKKVAEAANISIEEVKYRSYSLQESNPMLGHRGCRLAITYPEIYAMQAKAIFEACELLHKENIEVIAEIMIPLVLSARELEIIKRIITQEAEKINSPLNYKIGTMIELPRAALCADEIAEEAEFFSFGTNDLTQTTCGISRDDSGSFIEEYKAKQIFDIDPFVRIDEKGVGELVKIAIAKAKTTRNNIKLGICGEHGGNPASIQFFHVIGLEYVSCSPYRVPIARLAAAQAVIMTAEETVA
jgi:pyruvate,orthophosphate dikinase